MSTSSNLVNTILYIVVTIIVVVLILLLLITIMTFALLLPQTLTVVSY